MTTGKTVALTRQTFDGKVMSLLFNMLSRLVIGEGNGTPLQYFAWKIPWMEEAGRLQSMGLLRVRHDFTFTFTFHFHALENVLQKCDYGSTTYIYSIEISGSLESEYTISSHVILIY